MVTTSTRYDFDTIINRRQTNSAKWEYSGKGEKLADDVLPMWVADMDFKSAPEIITAMKERVDHGVFGYTFAPQELRDAVVERMKRNHGWDVQPDEIIFTPGVVNALAIVTRAISQQGDGILMQPPVYGPFFHVAQSSQRFARHLELTHVQDDASTFHYEIDFTAFEDAAKNPQTKLFYLCNPHNPGGFVVNRNDLSRLSELCIEHNVTIISDDIHCDLLLDGAEYNPAASLSSEISQHTVTLMAPSKTFNLAGLGCSVLIVQNKEMREKIQATMWGLGSHVNALGYIAAQAAYQHGDAWLQELRAYLTANRDYAIRFFREHMPIIKTTIPEATYLLWVDCRDLPIEGSPAQFWRDEAKVAMNDGTFFGQHGAGFTRLNFGCPRELLEDGLHRMKSALERIMQQA